MVSWEAWALGAVIYVILAALLAKLVLSLFSPAESLPGPGAAGVTEGATALTPLQFAELAQPLVFWGAPTAAGACMTYTFPASVDDNGVSYPGFPSSNAAVLAQRSSTLTFARRGCGAYT